MPDKKTAVFITDNPNFLVYDLEDLSTKGWLAWNESDFESSATGATHVVEDISTGDLIGIMTEMKVGIHTDYQMAFYRIKAEDITKKELIGRIPIGTFMPYMHSFGHTEDLLIF